MKIKLISLALIIILFKAGIPRIHAQNHPNGIDFLIENIKYPDFTYAGVPGGIPTSGFGNTYNVTDYTGTDQEKVQLAVDEASGAGGGIIYMPADTYYFETNVVITSDNIVIRGDGRDKTIIIFQGSTENNHNNAAFIFKGEGTTYQSQRIINDVDKGDRLIVLDDDYGYQPGDFFLARVHNDDIINSKPFYRDKFILSREDQPYDFMHEVLYQVDTSFENKLILTQPIRVSFQKSPPGAVEKGSAYFTHVRPAGVIKNCGVEDMRIETEKFASTMYTSSVAFTFAYGCWIKNLYIFKTGSLPFQFHDAKNVEVRNCVFDQSWNTGGGGNGYCVFWRTHDGLMDNVTTFLLRHAPNLQSFAGGCVVRNSEFYNNDAQWHGRWTHENLYENIRVISDENDDAFYFLLSNELNDNIASHEPHLHGNVVYNSVFEIHRSFKKGAVLGGLYKDWVFAYNKFLIHSSASIIELGDWCDGVDFLGNNFGYMEYTSGWGVFFKGAFSTKDHQYSSTPSNNKNIRFIDNGFYNMPAEKNFYTNFYTPTVNLDNSAYPGQNETPRPTPSIPSIYNHQQVLKDSFPVISITSPLPGEEFIIGDEINIDLKITGNAGYGNPVKVEFYFDSLLIDAITEAPFSINWKSDFHSRDKFGKLKTRVIYPTDTFIRYNKIRITPPKFNLSVISENGKVTIEPDKPDYFMNDKATLSAEGNLGWGFNSWSGDITHSLNPVTISVDSNIVITAGFTPVDTFRLFIDGDNGGVKMHPDDGIYNAGKEVLIEAIPFQGYKFDNWEGDNSGSTNPDTIHVDTVKNIRAHFIFDPSSDRGAEIDYTDPVGAGIITARSQQNELESKEKAFDNLYVSSNWSKWLDNAGIPSPADPSWIQIDMPWNVTPAKIAIVSANDVPGRDPKNFSLKASSSINPQWETAEKLGSWNDITFTSRFQYLEFPVETEKKHNKFRLEITANRENMALTQLAEILILAPSGFHYLKVEGGSGTGYYPPGWKTEIVADIPLGYGFHQWTGDTQYIEDITLAATILNIPSKDVAVTATYIPTALIEKNTGKIKIFPNPVNDLITIDLTSIPAGEKIEVTLFSLLGKRIHREEYQGGEKHKLNLKELPPGIYLVKYSRGSKASFRKITKISN